MRSLPPVVSGSRPVIGHSLEFVRDPVPLIERGHAEHGDACTLRIAGQPMIILAGPDNAREFFARTDDSLSIRDGMAFLSRLFGRDFYFLADTNEYRRQREIVLPRFQSRQLEGYLRVMESQAAEFIRRLGDEGEFDLLDELGPVVMQVGSEAFLGQRMDDGFFAEFRQFSRGADPVLPGWLPLPHFIRSRRARARLRAVVRREILLRREHPAGTGDFLHDLARSRYSDGSDVPDDIKVNLVLGFLWAGHETTAGQLAWSIIDLLRHPAELDKVLAEQREVMPGGGPADLKTMRRLAHLLRSLSETERLHPALPGMIRSVAEDTRVGGYLLPRGSRVLLSTTMTHRAPGLFEDPDEFRPDRYRRNPKAAHQLIGFGGGMHRCLGMHFARLEMQVLITWLLRAFDLELVNPDPQPVRGMRSTWPRSPCRVRYRQRAVRTP
ncbi:MAG: cytochrome P450 [Nocardiopsaceae bacterium]|nr:cytochrome P450 [Nocardiopsaceae bacterium]